MNTLVAVGALAAWSYSMVALLLPGVLPAGTVHVYFEAAAVIITLILLGRWLEGRARARMSGQSSWRDSASYMALASGVASSAGQRKPVSP